MLKPVSLWSNLRSPSILFCYQKGAVYVFMIKKYSNMKIIPLVFKSKGFIMLTSIEEF